MEDQLLYAEDAVVGGAAPERSHELTRTDLVRYAGASGDFNPMHHDEVKAQAEGTLTRYAVRFTKQAWPGDVLQTKITITGVDGAAVDLSCDLVTEKGVTVISGEASAQLPSRASEVEAGGR